MSRQVVPWLQSAKLALQGSTVPAVHGSALRVPAGSSESTMPLQLVRSVLPENTDPIAAILFRREARMELRVTSALLENSAEALPRTVQIVPRARSRVRLQAAVVTNALRVHIQ